MNLSQKFSNAHYHPTMLRPAWLDHWDKRTSQNGRIVATSSSSSQGELPPSVSHWKEATGDIVASIVGSAACTYTGQPFDTMKVRLQVNPNEFTGILPSLRKTVAGEGVAALWKGSVPAMVGALSENVVAFATNGILKRMLQSQSDDSLLKPLITGGITGALSAVVLCPCDILKCRAQVNIAMGMEQQSMTQLVKEIFARKGVRGFFVGFGPQLIRDIPFYASFFGTYDILCYLLKKYTSFPETSVYFIAGGIAGQVGWIISIAPDTIKSRIQTSESPLNFMNTARQIIGESGIRGLFAGIEVAVIRAFPANAALFVGYEWSRKSMMSILD